MTRDIMESLMTQITLDDTDDIVGSVMSQMTLDGG